MHMSRFITVPLAVLWFAIAGKALLAWLFGVSMEFPIIGDPPMETAFGAAAAAITIGVSMLHIVTVWLLRRNWLGETLFVSSYIGIIGAGLGYGFWWMSESTGVIGHAFFIGMLLVCGLVMAGFKSGLLFATERTRMRSMGANQTGSDVQADVARATHPKTSFKDIFGNSDIKVRLKDAAEAIVAPRTEGKQIRNGILLSGEPGNGKTVFAEALAGELKLPFLQLSYSDVASQWVGEKTSRINAAFAQARRQQPCVLFIDEVDSFLESRDSGRNDGTKEDRDVVNALLTLMVDIRKEKVILIAATNHIDRLDGAGIREGRFDFKVEITPPDREARVGLLTHGLKTQLPTFNVDAAVVEAVARRWNGFSVKRILAVTEELPSYLARETKTTIAYEDFMGALRMLQGRKGSTPENVKPIAELVLSPATREMLDLIVGRMADPEHTESHGGTLPTGVLFFGPPGTGKTATAKALAKEIDWAFLPATGADLARDPKALEKLYAKAKELRPCVIFVDEADELLKSRDYSPNTESTNKLLTLMDGVNDRVKDVVWVAATNNPEQIDAALLRGGRFTEKVLFERPSAEGLAAYLEGWFTSRKVALESGLTSASVAEMVGSESIANAEALVQAALNRAISRRSAPVVVTRADVEQAMRMVL
ncbi:MAG: AAA family ATPase [Burkholderiales bacterium]|nr:MAG: AAA family ATPase [Burkholderiales bacterium]